MREPLEQLSRRRFLGLTTCAVLPWLADARAAAGASIATKPKILLPPGTPAGVGAIIAATLQGKPGALNTDWFGTTLMQGLLQWSRRGACDARAFAEAWLDGHIAEKGVSPYSGPQSRVFRAGGVPITTYVSHFGLAMPCYEMATWLGDTRARKVCGDIGRIILDRTERNRLGLVDHFDGAQFAIPDTAYFVVTAMMIAAVMDADYRRVFREQALLQLQLYTDTFLNPETGLARTIWFNRTGIGRTYWTRASGWLLWAMTGALRFLPETDPRRAEVLRNLERLAQGLARVQDRSGGFRVWLDDPKAPIETTGTAMFASGIHEAVRRGWLDRRYHAMVAPAWKLVKSNLMADGRIRHAYTGWALQAEERRLIMDQQDAQWVRGFILIVADEMTTVA
ncbi:MAG: glycoside hydrolase family 88 protein [Opitutaceae bacterium]